jgi:hypothetical protein
MRLLTTGNGTGIADLCWDETVQVDDGSCIVTIPLAVLLLVAALLLRRYRWNIFFDLMDAVVTVVVVAAVITAAVVPVTAANIVIGYRS